MLQHGFFANALPFCCRGTGLYPGVANRARRNPETQLRTVQNDILP